VHAVNETFYVEVLKRLTDALRLKRGEQRRVHSLILHQDNALVQPSPRVTQFLAAKDMSATDHPPYSSRLASADFSLFPNLKSVLKGKLFSDAEDIESCERKRFWQLFLFRILKTVFNNGRSAGSILNKQRLL
jgi:hypothetical protein